MNFWKKNIDSLIAAVLGFIIVQMFTQYGGIGISPDSIAYAGTARNVMNGQGFTEFNGSPLVSFPMFYPAFLVLVMLVTQQDIVAIAPVLNGLLFAALLFLSGVMLERFKHKTPTYKRIILLIMLLSPGLIEIYTMLWSETLFIFLSLVFIFLFQRYFKTHTIKALIAAAVVAAIAFDTRYAGITLVGTGCLLLFFDKNLGWKRKAEHILIFGSIGCSLAVTNLIRNTLVKGLATGMRQKGVTPLFKNVEYSGNVMSDWFGMNLQLHLFFILLSIAVMVLFVTFFVRNFRHWKAYYSYENVTVSFFIVYVLFIVVSSTISRYETINNRLLGPAFIPLLWTSTCQIPKWRKKMPHIAMDWIFFGFSMGIAASLVWSYWAVNKENLEYMNETGIPGYNEDTWTKSPLIHYLQRDARYFDKDSTVYSNHSQAVYFLTGHSVSALPERVYKEDVREFKTESPIVLIWFDNDPNTDLLTLKEIRACKKMEKVNSFEDGAIYILKNE